jgi:hypothetical protein
MEYGEAVTDDAFDRAVAIGRALLRDQPGSLNAIAATAVAQAYCVCVTDGEDAAERHFSEVHMSLIAQVAARLGTKPPPVEQE